MSPCRRPPPRVPIGVVSALALLAATTAAALDATRSISQYSHRMWQDELPQTSVHAILQSRDGYLWLATYDGLVRFDGVRFRVYETGTRPRLPGSSAMALFEDRSGRLWVGTNEGVAVLEGESVTVYGTAQGLPGASVVSFSELGDGALLIGTTTGPARFDGTSFTPAGLEGAATAVVRSAQADRSGTLFVCTDDGLLVYSPAGTPVQHPLQALVPAACRSLLVADDGTVWAGTSAGVAFHRQGQSGLLTVADGLPSVNIRVLFEDADGALWIGTQSAGVARLAAGRWTTFSSRHGLSHDLIRSIAQDHEGSIWVGTNAGLDQLREARVTAYTTSAGLSNDFVRCMLEDRDGVIWIGTDGGGVNRFSGGRFEALTTADGLPSSSVRAMAEAPDGALWLGTRAGVCRLEQGRVTTLTRRDGLSSDLIRALLVDRAGVLWIGTEGGGLNRLAGGTVTVLRPRDGLAGDEVRAIFEDRRGRLWTATNAGVSVLEQDRVVRSYTTKDGLADNNVFSFFEDERGGLWIGTKGGLSLLREGRFSVVNVANGLVDDDVYWILDDGRGNLWTTSNRGISRLSLQSLYDVVEGRAGTVQGEHFDTSHGMPTNHCNGVSQPAGWRTRNGRLWFPTTRGAVEIDPAHLVYNQLAPPVQLEEVVIDGQLLQPGEVSVVPHGRHNYELRYTALSFAAPERVRFRYRLDGFDDDWNEAGSRRSAFYTRLPAGSYTFRVIACNNDGVWNQEGASLAFRVKPALWTTWWARLLALVGISALLLAGHRLRVRALARAKERLEATVTQRTLELAAKVRQLEVSEQNALEAERRAVEANRVKSLFLSTMSHELRTPLNAIIGFAAILLQRLEGQVEPRHFKFLNNIKVSGEHLLGLINDLLDLAKIEAGRMELALEEVRPAALIEGVCRLAQGMSDRQKVTLTLDLAESLPSLRADPIRVKQILFNLLSNAVKFSPEGPQVTVKAAPLAADGSPLGAAGIRLDVIDHGIGIAKEYHQLIFEEFRQASSGGRRVQGTGLGLSLARRLVHMHGGTITVESEPNRGSTFTVCLPLDPKTPLA